METICGSLLQELQDIWDEVGESEEERDSMLLEIEQECLKVYKGKVDDAKKYKAQLQQSIARNREEISDIYSALGDQLFVHFDGNSCGGLKRELEMIVPHLEEMKTRKMERKNQFMEIVNKIESVLRVISTDAEAKMGRNVLDETDLSIRRLDEIHVIWQELQYEKRNRLKLVKEHFSTINSCCSVLGMDFKQVVQGIDSNSNDLNGAGDLCDDVIKKLRNLIQSLQAVKVQRWQKLQGLAASLMELWNLLDIPLEEREDFQKLAWNITDSKSELTEPNMLTADFVNSVEAEVSRLGQLKSSKLEEIVLKKKLELDDICKKSHMVAKEICGMEISVEALKSGSLDAANLLEKIDLQIATAKEEVFRRKEILKKVEKWMAACEEECWLEEYNRDDNHYYAGRGAHLTLKRAEKARAIVNKIPAMVGSLASTIMAWEKENGAKFSYDGTPLLSMLEQYSTLRQEKEQEKQRQREQKKLQDRLIAEKEALYGSKANLSNSGNKGAKSSLGNLNCKKLSIGGALIRTPKLSGHRKSELPAHSGKTQSSKSNGYAIETPLIRKPLSPVTITSTSNSNIKNSMKNQNSLYCGTLGSIYPTSKALSVSPSKSAFSSNKENSPKKLPTLVENEGSKTPEKSTSAVRTEDYLTPKTMPIPVPTTPPTVSVPMVTAMNPATPYSPSGAHSIQKIIENIEYSVEEARAGFIFF